MKMVSIANEVNSMNMDADQKPDLFITSSRELDSLGAKFKCLCITGYKATLNFTCANGRTVVDFHIDLGLVQSPLEVPPPAASMPSLVQICHKSPSYYRCLKRRREARACFVARSR